MVDLRLVRECEDSVTLQLPIGRVHRFRAQSRSTLLVFAMKFKG